MSLCVQHSFRISMRTVLLLQNSRGSSRLLCDKKAADQPPTETNSKQQEHPDREKEPLKPHPGGKNPHTGEIGGPAGPEPTRYGDWERKGRAFDF